MNWVPAVIRRFMALTLFWALPSFTSLGNAPVAQGPQITTQPVDVTATAGETVVLRVGATGTGFLQFQWFLNGAPIDGASGATLLLEGVTTADSGTYTVQVTDNTGTVTSSPAIVTVAPPRRLTWTRQPTDLLISPGETLRLEVEAAGSGPLEYIWRRNGNVIPGVTGRILEISNAQASDAGTYTAVASSPETALESRPAIVQIRLPVLPFTDNFSERGLISGSTGAGTSSNHLATLESAAGEPLHVGKQGGRSIWVRWVAPASGRAEFSTAGSSFDTLLAVYAGTQLNSLESVAADDDRGGFLTSMAAFYAIAGTEYQIAVDGMAGADGTVVLSWSLREGSAPMPRIISAPRGEVVTEGTPMTLSVEAEGEGLVYEWLHKGQLLTQASGPTLYLPEVTPEAAGAYQVRVRNSAGETVELPPALVEVVSAPGAPVQDKVHDLFLNPGAPVLHAPGPGGFNSVAPGIPGWRETSNDSAQRSPEDPVLFGTIGGASLWWRFRATAAGWMRLSTEGSAIPTVLGVFTNRFNLRPLSESRPEPPNPHCVAVFGAIPGEDYLVMVDGLDGTRGAVRLSYSLELAPVGAPVLSYAASGFQMEVAVPPGHYEIAAGSDAVEFTPVFTTNIISGMLRFIDPAGATRRFYRVNAIP